MKRLDDKTRRLLLLFGVIIILIVLIIIIAALIGNIRNKSLSYEKIEDKLSQAAEKYYEKNKHLLPSEENGQTEVDSNTLARNKFMNNLSSYQKDKSASCIGRVIVTKSGKYYNFAPYLDCGDKYSTKNFAQELKKNIVASDSGLYESAQYDSNNSIKPVYIYRGEYVDNFVSFDNNLWRIVKIDANDNIVLIKESYKKSDDIFGPWDNRYNASKSSNFGINNYKVSVIRKALLDYYNSDILSASLKSKLVSTNICVANRKTTDTSQNGAVECKQIISGDYLSLLTTFDYINVSLDNNCKTIEDRSCGNYNYLGTHAKTFWLLNADSETTYQGYKVSKYASRTRLSSNAEGRIVLTINKNTIYVSGTGTETDPYVIK